MRSWRIIAAGLALLVVSVPIHGQLFPRLKEMRERRKQKSNGPAEANTAAVTARQSVACGDNLNVGYRVVSFSSGLRAAVWFPSTEAEAPFGYANGLASSVGTDAAIANCGDRYPVAVFSHGFGGCGTQSAFFTESLARRGYIVVAPDHKDAKCKVDQPREGSVFGRAEEPFRKPKEWSDKTYIDRRDDIRTILDELASLPLLQGRVDMGRVAGVGHSLGGYTMIGMAGGWNSWRDERIKVLLLFSPYAAPYLVQKRLPSVRVPVMYQGGTRDRGITPELRKAGGVYDMSNSPKYFVELKDHGHFDWTVRVCGVGGTIASCTGSGNAKLINQFGIQFLNRYVKGDGPGPDSSGRSALADFRSKE
ncbi:MAG: alpha/beta hydrolase family protein [Bryobacteraceae bacterium]